MESGHLVLVTHAQNTTLRLSCQVKGRNFFTPAKFELEYRACVSWSRSVQVSLSFLRCHAYCKKKASSGYEGKRVRYGTKLHWLATFVYAGRLSHSLPFLFSLCSVMPKDSRLEKSERAFLSTPEFRSLRTMVTALPLSPFPLCPLSLHLSPPPPPPPSQGTL